MKAITKALAGFVMLLFLGAPTLATAEQTGPDQNMTTAQKAKADQDHDQKGQPGAAREIGAGAGAVGVGAAKATGDVARGGGKAVVDAATLHPINAAGAAGKGVAGGVRM